MAPVTVDRTQPGWRREWLLGVAGAVGEAADCRRRRVGALIYDPVTFHVLAFGYNGRPAGLPGCLTDGACPRGQLSYEEMPTGIGGLSSYLEGAGRCDALHAEDNALRRARERRINVTGAWMAVTAEPCEPCYSLIRHWELGGVIWPGGEQLWTPPNGGGAYGSRSLAGL